MPDATSIQNTLDSVYTNWRHLQTQLPKYFLRKGNALCAFDMFDVRLPNFDEAEKQLDNPTSHKRLEMRKQWQGLYAGLKKFQHDLVLCGPRLSDDENINGWLAGFSLYLSNSGMILQVHHFNRTASVLHNSRDIAQALTEHADLNHCSNYQDFQIESPNTHVFGRIKAHSRANAVDRFHALTLRCFDKDTPSARAI